jgi:asparagine synthase (glutamine-hydrolysing)
MCGIAGILTFDGSPPGRDRLLAMADALRHRGPDAQGILEDARGSPGVGLVHRRLSIIDLSTVADQPLPNEDGSVHAMLNGEIYNFRELRAQLEGRHSFRSKGDTEVIVHLYEDRGAQALESLDGMFAFAIWDSRARRLLLARDHFGKKPLYYFVDRKELIFASEIQALLAAGVPVSMDEEHFQEYLVFGYVPTPATLFRGIRKLPPASYLEADERGVHAPRVYWDLKFPPEGCASAISLDSAAERVRELLTDAVRKRLIADVPLGVLLSGGVDSSAIAALAARLGQGPVKTFTVGFENDAFYDERPHAQRVADHIGAEHHASLAKAQAADLVETLLSHHGEPFGDSSALPTYLVAREARREVTVVLNGDGGDEAFAGYDRFRAALLADRIPAPLGQALSRLSGLLPEGSTYHGTLRRIRRFTRKMVLPFPERFLAWSSFFDLTALQVLLRGASVDTQQVLSSYKDALAPCHGASLLSRLLYLNLRTYLLDDLLPKMDRMTMAHGLEARSPLLDRPLLEFVAGLPDALKRRGGRSKVVLKEAVKDLLPPEIISRPKHGFGVPLGRWFRGELRPMVESTLLERPRLGARLRTETVRTLFDEHVSGKADHGHQLWTLLTLELWLRKHRLD